MKTKMKNKNILQSYATFEGFNANTLSVSTYSIWSVIMVSRERVECSQLMPSLADLRLSAGMETTYISSHKRNSKHVEIQDG